MGRAASASQAAPAAASSSPSVMNGRSPVRRMSAPAIGPATIIVAPNGISRNPAVPRCDPVMRIVSSRPASLPLSSLRHQTAREGVGRPVSGSDGVITCVRGNRRGGAKAGR